MTTSELLADCERMIAELERIGESAPLDISMFIHEDEQLTECLYVAVCRWKRIADRRVKLWRFELDNLKVRCELTNCFPRVATLHAELKEVCDGE